MADEIKKMDLRSMDVTKDRIEQLKAIFPEAVTEGKVDFEKLKRSLGEQVEAGMERYGMNWAGKSDCFRIIQQPSVGSLKPVRGESVNFDKTENLFIEGDNLEVLKLLQKSYYGKIKMIFIDPPYNTGGDFIYPDDYSESLDTYLKYTGQVDAEGRKYSTNTEAEGRYHTKWINMMYPRLYMARNLLRDDGVIFISIDDTEVKNLRAICDEILGEENFLANIVWQKAYVANMTAKFLSNTHDHILLYARNVNCTKMGRFSRSEEQIAKFQNPDNDPRGEWKAENLSAGKYYSAGQFEIVTPSGLKVTPPTGRYWRCNKETYEKWLSEGRIWFGKSGNGRPMLKKYLSEVQEGLTPDTWWAHTESGSNKEASIELKELFDGEQFFDTPKPVKLLRRMMQIATDNDSIVLDFFAGAGVLGEAAIRQNIADNGNRRFIVVQLPEKTDIPKYPTIADIAKERLRRVIRGLHQGKEGELNLGDETDLGFKVFKLNKSNFKIWDATDLSDAEAIQEQLKLHVDHVDPESSQEDILYELLLKSGFELTTKVEKIQLEGKDVFSIAEGMLLICLEQELTKEVIRAMADMEPARVICLDTGFKSNDQLKTNAVQIMKSKGIEDFLTV